MPSDVESELYKHVVWLCENDHPTSWDSVKTLACRLA